MIHFLNSFIAPTLTLLARALAVCVVFTLIVKANANEQQALQEPGAAPVTLPGVMLPTPFWLSSETAPPSHPCHHRVAAPSEHPGANPEPMPNTLTTQSCLTQHKLTPLENISNNPELLPDIFAEEKSKPQEALPISVGGKIELDEDSPEIEITGGQITIDIKTQ